MNILLVLILRLVIWVSNQVIIMSTICKCYLPMFSQFSITMLTGTSHHGCGRLCDCSKGIGELSKSWSTMQDIISCLIQMVFIGYWFGSILHLPMSINFVCGKFRKYRFAELWEVMAKIVEAFGWIKQWPGSAGSWQYGGKSHFVMHSMNFGPMHNCHLMQRRRRKWMRHLPSWLGYWKMGVRPSFASLLCEAWKCSE
jgi:hypothetical protein